MEHTLAIPGSLRRPITPILLASALESDRRVLREVLTDTEYVLVPAANWNIALNLAGHLAFSIILYDRRFEGIDWRLAVRRLASAWRIPTVVLLSETGEEGLGSELRASGGLEILVRPFEARGVWRALHAGDFRAS
jgi:CheY-like chemotaxis protein